MPFYTCLKSAPNRIDVFATGFLGKKERCMLFFKDCPNHVLKLLSFMHNMSCIIHTSQLEAAGSL